VRPPLHAVVKGQCLVRYDGSALDQLAVARQLEIALRHLAQLLHPCLRHIHCLLLCPLSVSRLAPQLVRLQFPHPRCKDSFRQLRA
jgi:hypothetical protein